ncbi:MAG: transrane sensor, partial [Verrucomicrobiota bacterium]|nr:transrane sensor [Verrucomicrobiota bacterium]
MKSRSPATTGSIEAAAALWLSRRDRGLTPAEQDEYMQWLAQDPLHAAAITRHAAALERMMQLYDWQPRNDLGPNPDLFAPTRSHSWWRWSAGLAAAVAVAAVTWLVGLRPEPVLPEPTAPRTYLHVNERIALPDGSRVELRDGSRIVVQYSEAERRVRLEGGEAHFT